jgi:L,D-transpeptidase catalytic domain
MGLRCVGKQGGTVQNEKRPGQGPGVLSRHRNALLAMAASFAVLAGFSSSAEAFFFDWPWNASRQPSVSRRSAPVRQSKPPPLATQPRENPATASRATSSGTEKAAAKETPAEPGARAKGVLTIAVAVNKQQLTVYSDGVAVARTRVTVGHQTPTGVFSIIQKDRWHRSASSGDAPMYYMQQITRSGVGLYQATPNASAPQRSIAMPEAFARQLWAMTKTGVRVVITPGEVAPAAISNARLFARRVEPVEPKRSSEESAGKIVDSAHKALRAKGADPALDAMAYAGGNRRQAPAPSAEPATSSEVVKSAYDSFDLSKSRRPRSGAAGVSEVRSLNPGPISVFISRKEGKLFVRKGFDAVFSAPVTFREPERPLGTHVFTALDTNDDDSMRWNVVTVPTAPAKPASRSRFGDPSAELLSVGRPSSAAEALERVSVPPEASERISELLSVGASVIISDQGLSPETVAGTDFIVLTP